MMEAYHVRKSPCLPTSHPSRRDRNPIYRPTLYWNISANLIKALPPEELASPGHMIEMSESMRIGMVTRAAVIFYERRTGDSKLRIRGKSPGQKRKISRFKRNIGIQVANDIAAKVLQPDIACIKGVRFRRELTVPALRHPQKLDPRIYRRVLPNDFIRPVGRAVTYNYPFTRQDFLGHDRPDRGLKKSLFVTGRCHERVAQVRRGTHFVSDHWMRVL
jgi:hypothetical protein